jgi:predicted HAD superfamily Cof-like phosphohydrolase
MDIRDQVLQFHKAAEVELPDSPTIPSDNIVRLRARLLAEEFMETISCMFDKSDPITGSCIASVKDGLKAIIDQATVKVDLEGFADGLCDIAVINEGAFEVFGLDSRPIQLEVHRSNMDKFRDGVKRRADGKILKPEGWTSPNIKRELEKQGWK